MDLIEAGEKIREFERRVMWRKRWLALQDRFAVALAAGGLSSAAFILYARMRVIEFPAWAIALAVFGVIAAALGALWYATRAREREAAFLIDEALDLEDRVSSATLIIERGGPGREVERALLDDAAQYISGKEASEVLPYRLPRWYGLAAAGLVVLGVAAFIPQKSLPGGEALAEELASVEIAGEKLEQAALEVEQVAPRGTETATLAQEQAELGRALRRSNDTRAEALKKLGTLGERIQQRHDELASTRADEIVSIAQRRLGSTLSAISKSAAKSNKKTDAKTDAQADPAEGQQPEPGTDQAEGRVADARDAGQGDKKDADSAAKPKGRDAAAKAAGKAENKAEKGRDRQQVAASIKEAKDRAESKGEDSQKVADASRKPEQGADKSADKQKPATDSDARQAGANQPGADQQGPGQKTPSEAPKGEAPGGESKGESKGEPQAGAEQKDSGLLPTISNLPNAVTDAVTEQAAKALPSISEQLLKKAEQLRANELKPEDIQQLRQAAEFLAKDLSQIAQSKELMQAVEQMARQINPEQLERVAEQLLKQENVRKELEAAARLLSQNRQIRDFVAGLERDLSKLEKPDRAGERGNNGGGEGGPEVGGGNRSGQNSGAGRSGRGPRGGAQSPAGGDALSGKGREARVGGVLDRKPGGEYLYLQTRPGIGAARLPYSSAYPQYRRQAERSVERSNVPPHMRSVVRSYFDAINPDGKKQ